MAKPLLKTKHYGANISLAAEIIDAMDRVPRWEFATRSHYVHCLVVPDLQKRGLLPPSYPPSDVHPCPVKKKRKK